MHLLKLTDLYAAVGVSKQSMYKYRIAAQVFKNEEQQVVAAMTTMRKDHKKMSSRKVYDNQKEAFKIEFGRDKFEAIAFARGYRVKRKRQVYKTTYGQSKEVYPDLVSGITIDNINQVYQSDIFYLKVADKDYYGVTIIDVYSKRLLALNLSKTLKAIENIRALKKVVKLKTKSALNGCIFHSDRGTQYISNEQKDLLKTLGMKISMCKMPQQNAYVERVQQTLKYEYFFEFLLTEKNITRVASKVMKLYNDERPHQSLHNKTPKQFELMIEQMKDTDRPKLQIYEWIPNKYGGVF